MATTDLISSEPHHQSSVGVVASNKTDAVPHGDSHSIDLSWRDRLVITMNRGSHHFGKRVAQWLVRLAILMIGSVVAIFDLLSMPYYLVKQKPWLKWPKLHRQRSVPDPNNPDRPGQIVRCAIRELPEHFLRECRTIDEALERGIEKEGRSRECIGYREVLSSEPGFDLEGKPLTKYELSDYKWLTYGQMYDQIVRFGHGLRQLGAGKQDKVMIFADTSARWFITGQAIIKNGSVLTTLYATVGDQGILHAIGETKVEYLITTRNLLLKVLALQNQLPHLKCVVLLDVESEDEVEKLLNNNQPETMRVHTYQAVVDSGRPDFYLDNPSDNQEDDLVVIMYTSGSGGVPKGVLMTHRNLIQGMIGILSLVAFFLHEMNRHTYIAYLPLAHILEFGTEAFIVITGGRIGYSSPHTLTDMSLGLKPGTKGDATLLKPTQMAAVPLVLDRIRKAIYNSLNEKGLFAVKLFEYIVEYKTFWMSKGFETTILDKMILQKFKHLIGGRLEMMMAGGAPLSADTQKLVRACLNVIFAQGYGCTESVTGLFMDEYDYTLAKVGGPVHGTKFKLVDWIEGGYCTTDKPNPRGEIHLSGPSISEGYFNLEQLTKETYYHDERNERWFKTGDVGELFPNGTLKIIDRKKDFIKLQFGEYVSLGKIETKYKTSYLVNQICVVGNSLCNYLVAVVVPNLKAVEKISRRLAQRSSTAELVDIDNLQDLYNSPKIKKIIHRKLIRFARKNGLRRYEIPREFILVGDEWVPETGLVTASFKTKRKNVEQKYADLIQEAFQRVQQED